MREDPFTFVGSPSVMAGGSKVTDDHYLTSIRSSTHAAIVLLTSAGCNYLDAAWFRCSTEAEASGGASDIGRRIPRSLVGRRVGSSR